MLVMDHNKMVEMALKIRHHAYSPYSKFCVGAVLLTRDGDIYTGVNIENATYGATNCAERTAIFKAVSEGKTKFKAIAIAGDGDDYTYPCGICRQVLAEFADSDMEIICGNNKGEFKIYTFGQLLPHAFELGTK